MTDLQNRSVSNWDVLLKQLPIIGPINVSGLLALAGILGPLVFFIGDYVPALTTPGYNFIRDSISSLAWTKLGWMQTVGFLTVGLLAEIYVIGLVLNIHPRRGFRTGAFLLVLFGFGLLMIGAFHTDVIGVTESTVDGNIHGLFSKIIFGSFPIAALLISFSIKRDPHWQHLYRYTIITVILGFLLLLAVWLANNTNWFGLFERLLVANILIWVEVTAIQILRISRRDVESVNTKQTGNSDYEDNVTFPSVGIDEK